MSEHKRSLKVFLCHASEDQDAVREMYFHLKTYGVDAWLDKEKLIPGQDWELEIRKSVREADVVVVCLSKQFNQAGFRQKEVRWALDAAMEQPEGEIFIIPVRLEECDNLESLRKWHWVDLFEENGYILLMRALFTRAEKKRATITSPYVDQLPNGLREIVEKTYSNLRLRFPYTLNFGVQYVEYMLERSDDKGMLAWGIAMSMLDRDRSDENFEFEILRRHNSVDRLYETNSSQELQGYVNATLLLVTSFIALNLLNGKKYDRNIHEQTVYARLQRNSQFDDLPTEIQISSWMSVRQNLGYVIDMFRLEDSLDNLLNVIVTKLKNENLNEFYARGLKTVECTFKVYYNLINKMRSR